MLGSMIPGEVGLRLLLCPFNANVITRTACCSVGIVLPIYSTFKAIESKDQNDQQKWLLYWAAYGSFTIVETFTDKFLFWFPLYYHIKFAFLVWLQLPSADGARQLYVHHLRPFLVKNQARLDQIIGILNAEMARFVSTHQAECQLAKALFAKVTASVRDIIQPGGGEAHGAIEGPAGGVGSSESDDESD